MPPQPAPPPPPVPEEPRAAPAPPLPSARPPAPLPRRRAGPHPHTHETHYLAPGRTPASPALTALSVRPAPVAIPPPCVGFTLRFPSPRACAPAAQFLECLPDPVGVVYHFLCLARARLSGSLEWKVRHVTIELVEDAPGGNEEEEGGQGAEGTESEEGEDEYKDEGENEEDEDEDEDENETETEDDENDGDEDDDEDDPRARRIAVPLAWVAHLDHNITTHLKGYLLHHAARVLQHDGGGTAPEWLLAAVADSVRIAGHLADPGWRVGTARRWEEDGAGGLFLTWLMGEGAGWARDLRQGLGEKDASAAHGPRRPVPDLVRLIDGALATQPYDEGWWVELCGAPLPQLWDEFVASGA